MAGRFLVYHDPDSGYRFALLNGDDQLVAVSEPYVSRDACVEGVDWVRRNAPKVVLDDPIAKPRLHSVPPAKS
jgi:uncharacterized protein YegP (UPF0339 family)